MIVIILNFLMTINFYSKQGIYFISFEILTLHFTIASFLSQLLIIFFHFKQCFIILIIVFVNIEIKSAIIHNSKKLYNTNHA